MPRQSVSSITRKFAQTLRDRVRDCAAALASEAGLTIEHIAKSHIRKEEVVARVLEQRGDRPGLVHIIWAMEVCDSYRPCGTTRRAARRSFGRTAANACITISSSWTPTSA
jgi:hypothetical protein